MKMREAHRASKKAAFLEAFALTGVLTYAAVAAGINRHTTKAWCEADPEFKAAFAEAEEIAADRLESEAFRRAHDGVDRYVVSQGKVVIHEGAPLIEKVFSDKLLELLLRARRGEKFRDRSDVSVRSNIAVSFTEAGDKDL